MLAKLETLLASAKAKLMSLASISPSSLCLGIVIGYVLKPEIKLIIDGALGLVKLITKI